MVMGDFNPIGMDFERISGHPWPLISMLEFNEYLDKCCLFELSSSGRPMSWCNGHLGVNRSWEKLDKAIINNAFSNLFMSTHLVYLKRKTSNHYPMVVNLEQSFYLYGPASFHF